MDNIELIKELEKLVFAIEELDYNSLDALLLKAKLYVKKVFGTKSDYISMIEKINFHAMIYTFDDYTDTENDRASWKGGISSLKNIISTMMEDLRLSNPVDSSITLKKDVTPNSIFIVHGHDDEMKVSVARFLEKLGLNPVILHEQPDKGRNVLDKLIDESEVASFAIVLLSPDDIVIDGDNKATRARQNVVLELGFFIAKLGKDKVTALYRTANNFELPSDFAGILYKKYDGGDSWRFELAKELKASGFSVDMNKLF